MSHLDGRAKSNAPGFSPDIPAEYRYEYALSPRVNRLGASRRRRCGRAAVGIRRVYRDIVIERRPCNSPGHLAQSNRIPFQFRQCASRLRALAGSDSTSLNAGRGPRRRLWQRFAKSYERKTEISLGHGQSTTAFRDTKLR